MKSLLIITLFEQEWNNMENKSVTRRLSFLIDF